MSARDPLTGRFRVVQPTPPANPPKERQPFTGLDPFTAALVTRSPKVEPAQPMILPASPTTPTPTPPAQKLAPTPSPVLIGGIGAALGLALAALLKGVTRG